jgi:hypothetical protein
MLWQWCCFDALEVAQLVGLVVAVVLGGALLRALLLRCDATLLRCNFRRLQLLLMHLVFGTALT